MATVSELLKSDHTRQMNWLEGQIKKNNTSIFLNEPLAVKAFDTLKAVLIPENEAIEAYMFRYLSDSGKKKLVTTLRVADTRRKNSCLTTLQVNLEPKNNQKLEELAQKSGLTKTDLINKMIEGSNWIKKEEEQLEIDI